MKCLFDECLSPQYVKALAERGYSDSVHPMHVGLLGVRDDTVLIRAFEQDRIVVTANARDFRKLLARMPLHPGANIIEALEFRLTWQQIAAALAFIELHPKPADYMVNRVVEVSSARGVTPYELARPE